MTGDKRPEEDVDRETTRNQDERRRRREVDKSGHRDEQPKEKHRAETHDEEQDEAGTIDVEESVEAKLGDQAEIAVPLMSTTPAWEIKSASLETSVLQTKPQVVPLPQFSTADTESIQAVDLQQEVVAAAEKENVSTPLIEVREPVELETEELLAEVITNVRRHRESRIPQITVNESQLIRPYDRFVARCLFSLEEKRSVPAASAGKSQAVEKDESDTVERIDEQPVTPNSPDKTVGGSDGLPENQWPEPIEVLLGKGGGELLGDEPVIICIKDDADFDFVAVVETIVKRLYREKVSGTPDPNRFTDAEELADETRWVEAEGSILTIKLDEDQWTKLEKGRAWKRIWENRIMNELYAQEFGAVIINRWIDSPPTDHSPKIVYLEPPTVSRQIQSQIVRLFFGCLDHQTVEHDTPFGRLFNQHAERIAEIRWEKIESTEKNRIWDATTLDENESTEHRRMKILVVETLVEQLLKQGSELKTPRQIEKAIKTEHPFSNANDVRADDRSDVRADVFLDSRDGSPSAVFEVETLFAQGRWGGKPRDKLRHTFKKYEGFEKPGQINIVLDNLSMMLHLQTIGQLKESFRDWEDEVEKEVQYFTLDLDKGQLIPATHIAQEVQRLESDIEDRRE